MNTVSMKIWDSSFELGGDVSEEQLAFFKEHGVIVFRNFLLQEQVATYIAEQQRLEAQFIAEKKEKVNGIPLKFGKDDKGKTTIQRLCFSSLHSDSLQQLLADPRLQALTTFLHPYDGRVAENEKDGLVINNYINTPRWAMCRINENNGKLIWLNYIAYPRLSAGSISVINISPPKLDSRNNILFAITQLGNHIEPIYVFGEYAPVGNNRTNNILVRIDSTGRVTKFRDLGLSNTSTSGSSFGVNASIDTPIGTFPV
jgi:hypothetical protein